MPGLRIGEAFRLDRSVVDRVLRIHLSKFSSASSREVPLHPSTTDALAPSTGEGDQLCPRPVDLGISPLGGRVVMTHAGSAVPTVEHQK